MKLNQSTISLTVCVLFMLSLTLPLLTWWLSDDQDISRVEKRPLSQWPSMNDQDNSLDNFAGRFEAYYNDHFGFREKLVFFHNLIKFKLFGVSSKNRVIPGKDNWLFFNEAGSYKNYLPEFLYDEIHLELFAQLMQTRADWLDTLGSHYLVVPIPNKADVYGEYLPLKIKKDRTKSHYDQVIDYLQVNARFRDMIDVKTILLEAKKHTQVYLKTDTHWNEDGSKVVYEQIISRLRAHFPSIKQLEVLPQREKLRTITGGDLASMMNLQSVLTETTSSLIWSQRCVIREEIKYTDIIRLVDFSEVPVERYPVVSGCPNKKNKAIVIHDSFGTNLRPLLSQHFGTVIYSHYMEFNDLVNLIEYEKPDVVIDLRIARNFQSLFEYSSLLEEKMLLLNKDKLTDLKMTINAQTVEDHLEASYNVDIMPAQQGLHLHAFSHSPRLNFTFDPGPEDTPLVVEIKLVSEHDTSMALYYSMIGDRQYTSRKSLARPIVKGENNIILRLPTRANAQGKISFIPGSLAGDYELLEFNVFRQPLAAAP